jgi:hypothetical protein
VQTASQRLDDWIEQCRAGRVGPGGGLVPYAPPSDLVRSLLAELFEPVPETPHHRPRRSTEKLQDQLAYPPRLLSEDRAAAYVGFGPTKFSDLVAAGVMPPSVAVDGSTRWDRLDLDAAVENLKDRRRDPVKRDRDRLEERLRQMKEAS